MGDRPGRLNQLVFIDFNNILHRVARAIYSHGSLLSGSQSPTDSVNVFLSTLASVAADPVVTSGQFHVFLDSPKRKRAEIYAEYKQNRSVDRAYAREFSQVRDAARDALRQSGVPLYEFSGFEADDGVAQACRLHGEEHEILILSSDQDLWQCLSEKVHWYDYFRKRYIDVEVFRGQTGLANPSQWADVKALAGCSSDGVRGVEGIGEVNAIKSVLGIRLPSKKQRAIADGVSIYERNLRIVRLPMEGMMDFDLIIEPEFKSVPGHPPDWQRVMSGVISLEASQMQKARKRDHGEN